MSLLKKTVINLSSRHLNRQELTVLSKGLKFVPTLRQNNDQFIAHVEKGLQQLAPGGKVNYLRHQIADILAKAKNQITSKHNLTNVDRQILKELRTDPQITIAPADKGRATVIMDTPSFNTLTDKILSDTNTYQKLKKDPTARLQKEHRATLKELLDNNEIGPTLHKKLIVQHPQPPYARATIKVHKDPIKARLLVCSRNTVHYNTAQHLSRLLAPLGKTAKSFIADSSEFCSNISNIKDPGTMISYDVVDLFTNVPRQDALAIIKNRVQDIHSSLDTHLTPDSIIRLLNACISSTYFTWQDNIYQQTHGLPMGSPLSPLITEIYMTYLEETALQTSPVRPTCWYRKVDDTFVILHPSDDPKTLLHHLNTQHPRIQFTMEIEDDKKLPFLDVLIDRTDNRLHTSVYRKPTHTDQYIHFASSHPTQTKQGIIATLTRQAKNISSTPESLNNELNHLRKVFTNFNDYPASLVNHTIKRTLDPRPKPP